MEAAIIALILPQIYLMWVTATMTMRGEERDEQKEAIRSSTARA